MREGWQFGVLFLIGIAATVFEWFSRHRRKWGL